MGRACVHAFRHIFRHCINNLFFYLRLKALKTNVSFEVMLVSIRNCRLFTAKCRKYGIGIYSEVSFRGDGVTLRVDKLYTVVCNFGCLR